jgi:hypothetical protein
MARSFILTVLAMLAAASSGCQPGPLDDAVSRNDEQILHALLALACKLETREVVSDRPATPRGRGMGDADPRNLQFGLDLAKRPAHRAQWPHGTVCKTVRVVPESTIEAAFAQETADPPQWIAFGKAFDGAQNLVRISLPVYSEDGRRAVVYTGATCPFKCGAGFYHELRKTMTGWKIVRSQVAWES